MMGKTQLKEIKEKIEKYPGYADILHYFNYLTKNNKNKTVKEFIDAFETAVEEDSALDVDIVYYHTALDYLKDNDPSLRKSLEIAADLGFETKNINSEILASLLASDDECRLFDELIEELKRIKD